MKRIAMLLAIGVISATPKSALTNPLIGKWCSPQLDRTCTTPRSIWATTSSVPVIPLYWDYISPYWDCLQNLSFCQVLAWRLACKHDRHCVK
jgi:hypothetical protein